MCLLAGAGDLLTLFIGLELATLPLVLLSGWSRLSARSGEAALKYVLLAALSSGLLVFGLALVAGLHGSPGFRGGQHGPGPTPGLAGPGPVAGGRGLQDEPGPLPPVGRRCLRRSAHGGDRLAEHRLQGRGPGLPVPAALPRVPRGPLGSGAPAGGRGGRDHDRGQPGGHRAAQSEALHGLQLDQPGGGTCCWVCWTPPGRRAWGRCCTTC
jgi:hypothetical protein